MAEIGPTWQTTILGISRTFQESGKQWRVGEGRKEAKLAIFELRKKGTNSKQHQKWTTLLEPSKTKHIFGQSRGLFSLDESKGARK